MNRRATVPAIVALIAALTPISFYAEPREQPRDKQKQQRRDAASPQPRSQDKRRLEKRPAEASRVETRPVEKRGKR
jgi:hypothetical protein